MKKTFKFGIALIILGAITAFVTSRIHINSKRYSYDHNSIVVESVKAQFNLDTYNQCTLRIDEKAILPFLTKTQCRKSIHTINLKPTADDSYARLELTSYEDGRYINMGMRKSDEQYYVIDNVYRHSTKQDNSETLGRLFAATSLKDFKLEDWSFEFKGRLVAYTDWATNSPIKSASFTLPLDEPNERQLYREVSDREFIFNAGILAMYIGVLMVVLPWLRKLMSK